MSRKLSQTKPFAIGLLVSVILAAMLVTPLFFPGEDRSLDTETAMVFPVSWQWQQSESVFTDIKLPAKLPGTAGQSVVLRCQIPEKILPGGTLLVRSSMQSVQLFLGDEKELLYESGQNQPSYQGVMLGSAWHLVRLPPEAAGETLVLILNSPYQSQTELVNQVMYGSRSSLLFYMVRTYGFGLLCALLVLAAAAFLIGVGIVAKSKELRYLGLFDLFVGLWLLSESKLIQFFTGNQYLIATLAFFSLMLIPLPFLLYLECAYTPHSHRRINELFFMYVALDAVCLLADITGIADLYSTLPLIHVGIFIGSGLVGFALLWETLHWHNQDALRVLGPVLVLVASALAELVQFYAGSLFRISFILRVGMLVFIFLLAMLSVQRLLALLDKNREAKYFRRLAYQDLLTGCENRTAYYEAVARRFGVLNGRARRWLVLLDMNSLKKINDEFGHSAGDEALRCAAACMMSVFGEQGKVYRIGGDEFAILIMGPDEVAFTKLMEQFEKRVEQERQTKPYPFELAVGFGLYDPDQYAGFDEFSHEIDRRMYYSKKKLKETPRT